jgi:hypothetical protein
MDTMRLSSKVKAVDFPMSDYVHQYCVPEVERSKGKVTIWGVQDLTLWTIVFTIASMARSMSPLMDL